MEKTHVGLSEKEAVEKLAEYGKNVLPQKKPISDLTIIINQIKSPLIYILLIAALVSFLLKDYKDAYVILSAVFLNTLLGFYQERKAQQALNALRSMLTPTVRVVRGGEKKVIKAENLVPQDLVMISVGDRIPADGIVINESALNINEAVLTGESVPVAKSVCSDLNHPLRTQQVFMGSIVSSGRGLVIVTKTGKYTEFGQIAQKLSETEEEPTPLQKKLSEFAKILAVIFAILSILIFATGLIAGRDFIEMFTTSVALAVAAIPEGLAVSLTVILAIGMQRILKRKALVRRLVAAEALGSTTVIATDKTGTLTLGKMSVVKTKYIAVDEANLASILANDQDEPLEYALWEHAEKIGLNPEKILEEYLRVKEIPFDSKRKYMAVLYQKNNQHVIYIKGAPEVLLEQSNLENNLKQEWIAFLDKWGQEGLRLIALSKKEVKGKDIKNIEAEVKDTQFLGIVGIADPVRESVKEALDTAKIAGIKVKVITGDYLQTSKAVLKKLGIDLKHDEAIEGDVLENIGDEELRTKVGKIVLFARVNPIQKLKIVEALKKNGEVVALVGDGVNDAPALKSSNIGIVVAEATDVAKETADMVLLDSNFATIVAAIEEGRGIYSNIKKIILYLLSDSLSEIILVFGAIILNLPIPLTASQILWINIVTDGLPGLSLTIDPKEKNLLKRSPINPQLGLLDRSMKIIICIVSSIVGLLSLVVFIFLYFSTNDIMLTRTIIFVMLGISTLVYVFSVRRVDKPVWRSQPQTNKWLIVAVVISFVVQLIPLYNPFLQKFLDTKPIPSNYWVIIVITVLTIIFSIELTKIILGISKKKTHEIKSL